MIAEPTPGLLMGLPYGKHGTATVARRAPWHPLPKAHPIACLLVKLSWHLGGLNFPPVIDEDLLEHAFSGFQPGGGGASNVAMRGRVSLPRSRIPVGATQDGQVRDSVRRAAQLPT